MSVATRIAAAFALSLVIGAALQQSIMAARHAVQPLSALPLLAGIVLVISIVFALACRRGASRRAINRVAAALLIAMLAAGLGALLIGIADISPGVGGDILYGLAVIVDLYFLLPAAAAVPIYWSLLRGAAKP
jgi:hypothetical protein